MGMGLTNMTDRLSAIGGRLEIDTAPGRGTRITAAVDAVAEPAN
jgi:signal transduction histidine kinase